MDFLGRRKDKVEEGRSIFIMQYDLQGRCGVGVWVGTWKRRHLRLVIRGTEVDFGEKG